MNRAERRIVESVNAKQIRCLGRAVQTRDQARESLVALEIIVQAERLAGRGTVAMDLRLGTVRSALAAAEAELDATTADVAAREDALEAARLDIIIDRHLTEIGLEALGY